MRIVITKNGRVLIQEINPDIRYKSVITNNKSLKYKKSFYKNNKFNNIKQITYGNSTKNIFNPHKKLKQLEIDDVLTSFDSSKNNSKSLCKILNIDPNKNLNMPQSVTEKYFSTQANSKSMNNDEKNILSNVLISINKSIEKDASKLGINYILNNVASLKEMKDEGNNKMFLINTDKDETGKYITSLSLPKILPSYPLKYIISPKSVKNLKKQAFQMDKDLFSNKRLNEDNFRSKLEKDLKENLELSLKKLIKAENTNLITYLNKDNDIKVPFIERLNRFDDNKLRRLNKISQKTIFNKGQDEIIKERIKDKIRVQFRNTSEKYKEGLENIKCKLYKSEKIIISEENKIIDKKERYINQYNEAELNWVKSGALRFYNRNKPPINSATGLVIDK